MAIERRRMSFVFAMILLACFTLAAAPGVARAQDFDGDGTIDALDPCPHVALATPELAAGYKAILIYDSTGPGGGDDKVAVRKFWITTLAAFNPTTGDNVHLTLRNTITGATLWAVDFLPAFWTQPNPLKKKWKYVDSAGTANGARRAVLREPLITPPGSNLYKFRMEPAKNTNIAGPLGVGDGVEAIVEIQLGFAGICFSASADVCTNAATKDKCLP